MYCTSAVLSVRKLATACDSFAACRERSRLGMAMVAMIKMIATTINSSSNEKPSLFFMPAYLQEDGHLEVDKESITSGKITAPNDKFLHRNSRIQSLLWGHRPWTALAKKKRAKLAVCFMRARPAAF